MTKLRGLAEELSVILYVDGIAGLGHDRLFNWGVGVGLRIKY